MTTEPYQRNNLLWQIQQFQQRFSEWWEVQLRKMHLDWLNPTPPQTQPGQFFLEGVFKIVLAVLLIFLLVFAILQIIKLISPYFYQEVEQRVARNKIKRNQKTWRSSDWLRQSQFFQKEENYYQACRCLYMAMLQRLDEKNLISDLMSRTDEEYHFLTLQFPNPYPYHTLLRIHQQLCFSNQTASLNLWQECQRAYQEIENQI